MLEELIEKLKDKYVFFDVDGTLSEYRHKDRIYGGYEHNLGCMSLSDLLFSDLFFKSRPLKNMQKVISSLDSSKIFILGAITTNNEIQQKYKWLEINYPNIKKENIYFLSSTMLKPDVICEISKHFSIELKDIVFVDDKIDVLRKAEQMGVCSYHPSSFTE